MFSSDELLKLDNSHLGSMATGRKINSEKHFEISYDR